MSKYAIRVSKADRRLINITSMHPEPVEAFSFYDLPDGRVEVSTENKERLDLWEKTLQEAKKEYEIVAL